MKLFVSNIKEKMLEFTRLFSIETNVFQRFVIVYKYFRFLNRDPLVKNVLQKIFDETAKLVGEPEEDMNEDRFLDVKSEAIYSKGFWIYYTNLEVIHGKMKRLQKCHLADKAELEKLSKLFSKPYSKKMLELSFEVVNSEVFNRLDQESFCEDDEHEGETYFNEDKSVLYVTGRKVLINKQDKITNAHKVLRYMFVSNKDNLTDDFYYSEMADTEFGELDYNRNPKAWERYRDTCKYINKLVQEQTDNVVKGFLMYNTGQKGRVKINKKYL